VRIMFATAELAPVVRVGGLAEASAGLVRALRGAGQSVDVLLPDYAGLPLGGERVEERTVADWAGPMRLRSGELDGFGAVTLVGGAGIERPHPYVDAAGAGWVDNDRRFLAFAATVGALAAERRPDVVHLNDWHTGFAHAWMPDDLPVLLTIHTLGHQGWCDAGWLDRLPAHRDAYEWFGTANALLGSIRLARRVVAVSPTYAREIVAEAHGFRMHVELARRGSDLIGIRNGIDVEEWHPAHDPYLPANYDRTDVAGKEVCRAALLDELGWPGCTDPVVGMVTRLVDQKGVDLALGAVPYLGGIGARLVLLGAGDPSLADAARAAAAADPERVAFFDGYDTGLGHRILAGADLFLMPSRFEPCGLAQMQAMAYGTIPVVTDVGGLHDTVLDDDRRRLGGTGFVAAGVETAGVVDALHRAVRAWRSPRRRAGIMARGMAVDWSWDAPAAAYLAVYAELAGPVAPSSAERP
jgi:starch synthase